MTSKIPSLLLISGLFGPKHQLVAFLAMLTSLEARDTATSPARLLEIAHSVVMRALDDARGLVDLASEFDRSADRELIEVVQLFRQLRSVLQLRLDLQSSQGEQRSGQ